MFSLTFLFKFYSQCYFGSVLLLFFLCMYLLKLYVYPVRLSYCYCIFMLHSNSFYILEQSYFRLHFLPSFLSSMQNISLLTSFLHKPILLTSSFACQFLVHYILSTLIFLLYLYLLSFLGVYQFCSLFFSRNFFLF